MVATSAAHAAPVRNLREPIKLFMNLSPAPGGWTPSSVRGGYTGLPAAPTTSIWKRSRLTLVQHGTRTLIQDASKGWETIVRVLIAGFQHETNTFAPSKTGY